MIAIHEKKQQEVSIIDTKVMSQFEVMDEDMLTAIEGGGFSYACLGYGAASFAAGASAISAAATGAGLPVAMYLGAQALATGATLMACLS